MHTLCVFHVCFRALKSLSVSCETLNKLNFSVSYISRYMAGLNC